MARAPDWLLNMTHKAPGLVEDSPQFRTLEAAQQKKNIANAADSALGQLQDRVNQSTIQAIQAGEREIEATTPIPVPLQGPNAKPFFPTERQNAQPPIPGPEDFNDMPPADMPPGVPPPPDAAPPTNPEAQVEPSPAPVAGAGGQADIRAVVEQMAAITGLPKEQIATMALLGKEIQERDANSPPAAGPTPSAPLSQGMPSPLQGPSSLMGAPPTL